MTFLNAIGNTPLIELRSLSQFTGCRILAKAEWMNPCGSIKDRAALAMIQQDQKLGKIQPGDTLVEGTAGNTGVALTLIGKSLGYSVLLVVPETQSREKVDVLRAMGAEVVMTPGVPYTDERNFRRRAEQLAQEGSRRHWVNQFDHPANFTAHYEGTGPEIWNQTRGELDGFAAAVGSGGTLAGISSFLKEKNPSLQVACPDPLGSAMFDWVTHGEIREVKGESITEGIGQARLNANVEKIRADRAYRFEDRMVIEMLYWLLEKEGLFLGSSSAMNVLGAVKLATELGRGHTVATVLCDSGARYTSKLFNPEWLNERQLTPTRTAQFLNEISSRGL